MNESKADLWVLGFDDEYKADEARVLFRRMAGEGLLDLEESAVVVVGIDGKPAITQDADITSTRVQEGHVIGLIAASLTGITPLIMAGTLAGAVAGFLTDQGITTQMMKPIADSMMSGTSALFILAKPPEDDDAPKEVVERVRHLDPKIVRASVSPELRQQVNALLAPPTSSAVRLHEQPDRDPGMPDSHASPA